MRFFTSHWRAICSVIAAAIAFPVIGEWFIEYAREKGLYKHPSEQLDQAMSLVLSIADLPGFRLFAVFVVGIVVGVWVDTFVRRRERSGPPALRWFDPLEAIEEFADPKLKMERNDLRQRHRTARGELYAKTQEADRMLRSFGGIPTLREETPDMVSLKAQLDEAQQSTNRSADAAWNKDSEILDDLITQLKRGRLVGKGFRAETNQTSESQLIIPADHWILLKFNSHDQSRQTVEGGNKKYTGLQIGLNRSPPR